MTRYLTLQEVLDLQAMVIQQSGGKSGVLVLASSIPQLLNR